MTEGSVIVDGYDVDEVEQSTEETPSEVREEGQPSTDTSTPAPEKQVSEEESQETPELTEKGTKLDPNPQSAVHQQLANERRVRQQYEAVLKDPKALAEYMEAAGFNKREIAQAQEVQAEKKFSVEKLQTAEDVANALNELQTGFQAKTQEYEKTIKGLTTQLQGLSESRRIDVVSNTLKSDISTVREKYPELNPKSPPNIWNPALEESIGKLYQKLDYDDSAGSFRGNITLAEVTEAVMTARRGAKEQGSKEAQTIVKEKQSGKVVTSSKGSGIDNTQEPKDAGSAIAQLIKKAYR